MGNGVFSEVFIVTRNISSAANLEPVKQCKGTSNCLFINFFFYTPKCG